MPDRYRLGKINQAINRLEMLERGWLGDGRGDPVDSDTITLLRSIAPVLANFPYFVSVLPCATGGATIEWRDKDSNPHSVWIMS